MDKGVTSPLYGNYRAKVVSNKDKEQFGRVLVWIPDLMQGIPDTEGIVARPANNPIGGRNKQEGENKNYYAGTSYIPANGSWVWLFFESGNVNRPYYFAALDIQNTTTLPENRVGSNYTEKWVIFKSHEGRTIVISDDPDDARVEITGKKRNLKEPPSGDVESVYEIDKNQTSILLDEREGKEKILIRTHKGDYLHIDIDDQKLYIEFENDIEIKTRGGFKLTASDNIDIKSTVGDINIQGESGKLNIKTADSMRCTSAGTIEVLAQKDLSYYSGGNINGKAARNINHDGSLLQEQSGTAATAQQAGNTVDAAPKGGRDD